jgi:hypothetical protein
MIMKRAAALLIAASSAGILLGAFMAQGQEHQATPSAAAGPQPVVPRVDPHTIKLNAASCDAVYPDPPSSLTDRKTYCAPRTMRGTTVPIPEADVIKFCSGKDGCIVRMGMYNWDDTGRVASRHFSFYYNKDSRVWRAGGEVTVSALGDTAGTNNNNVTEHVANLWSCYFTDGTYDSWNDKGDSTTDFGLLSWNQYNADCFLTLVR